MSIIANPNSKLTQDEMLDIARLLVKAGYEVKIREKKMDDNKKVKYIAYCVEGESNNG